MAKTKKIRYAVVGLGHIAQVAILPAFKGAKNSELAALISSDKKKLKALGKIYGVKNLYSYDQMEQCLVECGIDAVYIATPNHLHREFVERAASVKVHVLCEKPLGISAKDCERMIQVCEENGVKLMTAYRLHFEQSNLVVSEIAKKKKIGDVRIFNSAFTQAVPKGNIRANPSELGGGPLFDIGIYCINAARYIFRAEPLSVYATSGIGNRQLDEDFEDTVSVIMHFPEGKSASFTCSFATAPVSNYQMIGTKGDLFAMNPYQYIDEITHYLTIKEKTKKRVFKKRDQFAPELIYFSDCILENREPEPSGVEGWIDLAIIDAIRRSIAQGKPVNVDLPQRSVRPGLKQEIRVKAHKKPPLIHVQEPSKEEAA